MLQLEMAVQDAAGVRIAKEIGAARVELTQGLALGGLTPSPATLELALAAADGGVEVHVLVRPRAGGFRYDADELAVIERDIRFAVRSGAAGVVIGCLGPDGLLDVGAMARLRDAAGDVEVTLHRAIDVTPDPVETLRAARSLGLMRVLSSGGASAASDGVEVLRGMVAEGGIQVMAGSGVTAENAAALAATGVDALHFSAKRTVLAEGGVRMGSASDGVGGYEVTDRDAALTLVRELGRP